MNAQPTFQQALDKFYHKNRQIFAKKELSEKGKEFFRCHDAAHVIFGCDTSFFGEGAVKIWTIFGTNLGFWNHIRGYNDGDAFSLFRMYSWQHVLKNILRLFVTIPKIIVRAAQMKKRWHWSNYEQHLHRPLDEIRKEFNIKVVKKIE